MHCLWCDERLTFKAGKGWLHPDGELYKTFVGEDGVERDDHCADPIPDDAPSVGERSYAWRRRNDAFCDCLTGCEECGGVPNHVAWIEALAEDIEPLAKEEGT